MNAIVERRQWAYARLSRQTEPAPSYGSREWLDLDDSDPVKLRGLITAAECWARDADDLETTLRVQVEASRRGSKRVDDEDYVREIAEHRSRWEPIAKVIAIRGPRYSLPPSPGEQMAGGDAS